MWENSYKDLVAWCRQSNGIKGETYLAYYFKGTFLNAYEIYREIGKTESKIVQGSLARTLLECKMDLQTVLGSEDPERTAKKCFLQTEKLISRVRYIDRRKIHRDGKKQPRQYRGNGFIDGMSILERIERYDTVDGIDMVYYDLFCHFTHAGMGRILLQNMVGKEIYRELALRYLMEIIILLTNERFFTDIELQKLHKIANKMPHPKALKSFITQYLS